VSAYVLTAVDIDALVTGHCRRCGLDWSTRDNMDGTVGPGPDDWACVRCCWPTPGVTP